MPVEPAGRQPNVHPFAMMAGTWTGGGTIDLTNDIHEKLRCRATYTYGQASNGLALAIRCASDNYKFELTSDVVERNGQISGQWKETAYNVSGSISGRVNGGRISAVANGDSFTAALSVNTNGNRQSVTITPQATYIINVQIAMNRTAAPATRQRSAESLSRARIHKCVSVSAALQKRSDCCVATTQYPKAGIAVDLSRYVQAPVPRSPNLPTWKGRIESLGPHGSGSQAQPSKMIGHIVFDNRIRLRRGQHRWEAGVPSGCGNRRTPEANRFQHAVNVVRAGGGRRRGWH